MLFSFQCLLCSLLFGGPHAPKGLSVLGHGGEGGYEGVLIAVVADGAGRIRLTLDGVEYRGFYDIGYDADQDAFVTTFSAMSADGQTVWGVRATGQDQ